MMKISSLLSAVAAFLIINVKGATRQGEWVVLWDIFSHRQQLLMTYQFFCHGTGPKGESPSGRWVWISDPVIDNLEDEGVQVNHVCQAGTVYIPWPFNVMSESSRDFPVITLSFQHRQSDTTKDVAIFTGKKRKIKAEKFKSRLVYSKEHAGVFVKHVNLDFDGMFTAQARSNDDRIWTRKTEVMVHLHPLVKDKRLNISVVKRQHPDDRKDCLTVVCGKVEYNGYPPVYYLWKHNDSIILLREQAASYSWSTYHVCPPFHGVLSCSIAGFSSICTIDFTASVILDLPVAAVVKGSTSDTILMIVIPVLAIGIPLLILGVWMCVHLLRTPRNRGHSKHNNNITRSNSTSEHNHVNHPSNSIAMHHAVLPTSFSFQSHHNLPPPILEDLNEERESIATIETSNRLIGLHSPPKQYRDPEETDKKGSPFKDDDDDEEEEQEEEDDDDDDEEEEEEDSDEDDEEEEEEDEEEDDFEEGQQRDVDQETREKQPLMEDSLHPIVT